MSRENITYYTNSTKTNEMDKNKSYEMVNHPSHYNKYDVEVIEMMRRIWGDEEVRIWCKLSAFKYRMRLGEKPENSIEQDLKKENFYLNYFETLTSHDD